MYTFINGLARKISFQDYFITLLVLSTSPFVVLDRVWNFIFLIKFRKNLVIEKELITVTIIVAALIYIQCIIWDFNTACFTRDFG